jgi:putative tricarboxylic transport membrane protein
MPSKWDMAVQALQLLLQPTHLAILVGGVLLGLALGCMPGLGGVVALAVLIPFTYHLDAQSSFALLLGVASVATTSDLIPAVLFGVPGTVGAAATVIDGHQMARQGRAGHAFGAGFVSAAMGGLFGALVLALAIPLLQPVMLAVGSPELLAFSIFGLSMVATLSGRAPLKGLTAAGIGLMISMIGSGTQTGTLRWTFGWLYLFDGIPLIPVTLGLFALPELADLAIRRKKIASTTGGKVVLSNQWEGVRDVLRNWRLVLKCSALGTGLGVIPGIGSSVIDWIVYGYALRTEKHPERFGQGDVRGVIAPESSNNAKEGGHLVPTIAFGVPAGASMTLLLGAFLLHGLTPGPDMLTKNLDVTYSIIWSLTLAHLLGTSICLVGARQLARFAEMRHQILLPMILPIVFIATFQATRSWGDLYFLFIFGTIGWIMKRFDWPRPPMVLGFVLGPIFERYLFLSTEIYGADWVLRPIVIGIAVLIAWALYRPLKETATKLGHEFRHIRQSHPRLTARSWFTLCFIALIVGAIVTSAGWPPIEQMVPRTACWAALLFAILNLITEIFGADLVAPVLGGPGAAHAAAEDPGLPSGVVTHRAIEFFGWLAGLVALASLIGFIPAIAVFVFLYMGFGFHEPITRTVIFAVAMGVFCWAVFDRGLAVPWPQAVLGDLVPYLRQTTGLM